MTSLSALAQSFDVSGNIALAFSKFGTNDKSLLAAQAPDSLWEGAIALRAVGSFGDFHFSSETAFSFEEFGSVASGSNSDVQLNEAHLSWSSGDFTLIAGRKRTRWGTGLVASPTEIISTAASPISPNDDFFQIAGRDLVQLNYTGISSSLDLLLINAEPAARHLEERAVAMRYYMNAGGVDFSFDGGSQAGDFPQR